MRILANRVMALGLTVRLSERNRRATWRSDTRPRQRREEKQGRSTSTGAGK